MTNLAEIDIDRLEAGQRLNALVARWVMNDEPEYQGDEYADLYSTDIAAAWTVVEKMRTEYEFFLWTSGSTGKDFGCRVRREGDEWNDDLMAFATTAPLAICRAALKTIRESQP